MERRYARDREIRRGGSGRGIAWLALFFSFLAFLTSATTLVLTWHDGQLLRDAQSLMEKIRKKSSHAPDAAPAGDATPAADAAPADAPRDPQANPDLSARWESIHEKLQSAEKMVRSQDGRVREFLDGLKSDIEQLRAGSAEKGAQWMDAAASQIKSIREQVTTNGPLAAKRLRELAGEVQQNIETVRRVSSALRGTPETNPAAETPTATPETQ